MSYIIATSDVDGLAFVVIPKRRGIIILTVCLVLLVPGYLRVRSVRPGKLIHGILQTDADFIVLEDLP